MVNNNGKEKKQAVKNGMQPYKSLTITINNEIATFSLGGLSAHVITEETNMIFFLVLCVLCFSATPPNSLQNSNPNHQLSLLFNAYSTSSKAALFKS